MDTTIFSHRPIGGVSVGAMSTGNQLFVAFAFVNNGSSRNGIFWEDRIDSFCRATARAIISGRIGAAQQGQDVPFTVQFDTEMTARQFIGAFRQTFKPTPDETDDFLTDTIAFGNDEEEIEVRYRPFADFLAGKMTTLAEEIVANASASV